ncbi:hypothetical protein AGMMS50293_28130 [Spirochaetia bacterium]|nr:hypothetical protein AGMMS50293_28130 [Spirochaetia bacterium]
MWGGRGRGYCWPLQGQSPPTPFRSGAYYAHPAFRIPIMPIVLSPTADVSDEASPKLRNEKFSGNNRPTASGQAASVR